MSEHPLDPTTWVDRYADYLFNYAVSRVSDGVIAEDLVQETFIAGLKSADRFKGQAAERTWLVSILKRKVIDHYRRSNTKKGKAEVRMTFSDESEEADWMETMVEDQSDRTAQDQMENEELGEAIAFCMSHLKSDHAEIFRMKTVENVATEEICNAFEITPSNLWVILHRTRGTLMDCLNKNWFKN